ncbi:hypothetical protein EBN03_05215 [Nocardia stercoris]|uniref:Uncharacterized protein n=2 Tax=Nocardia stercoris TaxID=2483361 RepID=A0A3M2LDT9_9NOCA|nr:hypothetical protein EBN03_05215 [Nocardia stercoris]
MVEGRVVRDASHPVRILFRTGPGQLLAVGERGPESKLPWRGRAARHRITGADGSILELDGRDRARTTVLRENGAQAGVLLHGTSVTAVAEPGGTVCHLVADPAPATPDVDVLSVLDPCGTEFARTEVVRTPAGWARGHTVDAAGHTYVWWDRTGLAPAVPVLGTRLVICRDLDRTEREILLALCTEIAVDPTRYNRLLTPAATLH